MRTRNPAWTAILLLSASCAAPQPDPGQTNPAQPAAPGAGAAEEPKDSVLPPSDPQARKVGLVILECDGHLRTWTTLMSQPRNEANQQKIGTLSIALGSYVAKNREILESQVISGGARNRGIASAALGFCGDPAAAPLIASNVSAEDMEVASKALLGLGVLCAEETPLSPILGVVMRADASPALLSNAAFCLYQLAIKFKRDPDGSMAAAFTELLRNPDVNIRAQSVLGLGLIQASSALPQITDMLAADPVPSIRTCAAYALGQIGTAECIEPLISALSDSDAVTAGTARASLARFYGSDLGPQAAAWRTATPK